MSAEPRSSTKPVLLFTCGDPAGIGPELVVRAIESPALRRSCRPVLVGESAVWRRAGLKSGIAPIIETRLGLRAPPLGRSSREGGLISFASFATAVKLALRGAACGIVTAPISKKSWGLAGLAYRDHTEYLREKVPAADAQMILGAPRQGLWCVLATRHVPFKEVAGALDAKAILSAAPALHRALKRLGYARPRLGLCALNPHAGEEGLLGLEESRVLAPAARRCRHLGINLSGPIAADTAWRWHREGKLDGLVCLYHDQALIPLKMAAGLEIVNWTSGLPFIRTSPGHGTGFDVAGKGRADPGATIAAAGLASNVINVTKE